MKYLYRISINIVLREYLYLTLYILEGCLSVVLGQLHNWIYKGQLLQDIDLQHENDFILFTTGAHSNVRDHRWWHNQFYLSNLTLESNVPWLFDEVSKDILRCGKSIKLLGLIDNSHALLQNIKVIQQRPRLELCYLSDHSNKIHIERYVDVVHSVAADTLRSLKEIIEEKRANSKRKALEAELIRNSYLKSKVDNLQQKRLDIHTQKKMELERLKIQAVAERQRKKEAISEEKRLDKLLIKEGQEANRALIDEAK